jgi:hypothetical protein
VYRQPVHEECRRVAILEVQVEEAIAGEGDRGWYQVRIDAYGFVMDRAQAVDLSGGTLRKPVNSTAKMTLLV